MPDLMKPEFHVIKFRKIEMSDNGKSRDFRETHIFAPSEKT